MRSSTFWLILTNILLGLAVVVLVFGAVSGILCETIARLRRRRKLSSELDEDMRRLFHGPPHR